MIQELKLNKVKCLAMCQTNCLCILVIQNNDQKCNLYDKNVILEEKNCEKNDVFYAKKGLVFILDYYLSSKFKSYFLM